MRRMTLVACLGVLALSLAACDTGPEDTAVTETPTAVPIAPAGESFPAPTVAGEPSPAGVLPPDLISSTDPNQRVQEVQSNRADPFALVPTSPIIQNPEAIAQAPQNVPSLPNLPSQGAPGGGNGGNGGNGGLAPIPQLVPNAAVPAPLPPQPDLARAVEVTGVVQIGTTLHAIVKAPNEATSRYVRVGQLLSNGQVLVKRIEVNRGAEPVVILEQNGIEVVTAVGEGGSPQQTAGIPAAAAIAAQPFATSIRF